MLDLTKTIGGETAMVTAAKGPDLQETQATPGAATPQQKNAQQVQNWVQRALDMGVEALRQEYRSLARYTLPEMTFDAFKANHELGRNRHILFRRNQFAGFHKPIEASTRNSPPNTHPTYQDVPCQDQNRVVLKWHTAATDYIHANYVATPLSEKRFILTQTRSLLANDEKQMDGRKDYPGFVFVIDKVEWSRMRLLILITRKCSLTYSVCGA
ncbi:hypothetical protein DICVIV_03446 [Dictyocaulus viviparus]|uniref:Tyrosine-protein phosphatase domain-containing protein n=1 Tax=Dictyocaulus viviparus TaxID=29172 RepID=A0A0D8Y171_DICVI|nr:hypothetical protein DICVIV_03446 [Dictyocaulus viviparus]